MLARLSPEAFPTTRLPVTFSAFHFTQHCIGVQIGGAYIGGRQHSRRTKLSKAFFDGSKRPIEFRTQQVRQACGVLDDRTAQVVRIVVVLMSPDSRLGRP
jgi:hypothetical protein